MIKTLSVSFQGSFQCRLATDNDATSASPTDPYGDYGPASSGWTFAYREAKFDRIIRLSRPVQLRSGLVDPWEDAIVREIRVDRGAGPQLVVADPLLRAAVSLGASKFDTSAGGGGVTREALIDFSFRIGGVGFLLKAQATKDPVLDGAQGSDTSWSAEYKANKSSRIAGTRMDPTRTKVLNDHYRQSYESFFAVRCPSKPITLKGVLFGSSVSGVLAEMDSPASLTYDWVLRIAFYRFDGDTLTGKTNGTLVAKHK